MAVGAPCVVGFAISIIECCSLGRLGNSVLSVVQSQSLGVLKSRTVESQYIFDCAISVLKCFKV